MTLYLAGETENFGETLLHNIFSFANSTQNVPVLSGERPASNRVIYAGIIVEVKATEVDFIVYAQTAAVIRISLYSVSTALHRY
jgi:hypothetical protein